MKEIFERARDLSAFVEGEAPAWMTPKHVVRCFEPKVQQGWQPKVGDWYFCADLQSIKRINDLGQYYHDPSPGEPGTLPSDSHIRGDGSWPCDTYIPPPSDLEKRLKK